MSIEKMREEFEVVANQHFLLRERFHYWDETEEEYNDPDVQLAYEFFVLSRESLVIELPFAFKDCDSRDATDVREAIHATGVKTK